MASGGWGILWKCHVCDRKSLVGWEHCRLRRNRGVKMRQTRLKRTGGPGMAHRSAVARMVEFFIAFALIFIASSRAAHAYIDPGTGSYLFQLAVASLAAAAFTLKVYWQRIRSFFGSSSKNPKDEQESSE